MSFLTAGQLAFMRSTVGVTLSDRGTVLLQGRSDDGLGGGTTVYTASGTVAFRVEPSHRQSETVVAGQIGSTGFFIGWITYSGTITNGDRIASNGATYEVENRIGTVTDYAVQRLELRRVE